MTGPLRKVAAILVALVLLLGFLQIRSWQQARQKAAEARVERGQAGAAQESAKDAIATQGAAAAREQASTDQEKTNAHDITAAQGAKDVVNPAARDAFLRAQCLRDNFRNTRVGKLRCAAAAGVEGGSR